MNSFVSLKIGPSFNLLVLHFIDKFDTFVKQFIAFLFEMNTESYTKN